MDIRVPREIKNQMTKEKVFLATDELLREYGFDYLTIRNICQRSNVAYSSFYYHFGSKEELVYMYCKTLFKKTLEKNSKPDFVDPNDYIWNICWPYFIFALFLETMGKPLADCLYQNKGKDLFWEQCGSGIIPTIHDAVKNGYFELRNRGVPDAVLYSHIFDDMEVLLKGAVFNWLSSDEEVPEPRSMPHHAVVRLMIRFLLSWASEKYHTEFQSGRTYSQSFFRQVLLESVTIVKSFE